MDSKKIAHFFDKKKKDGEGMSDMEKKAKISVLSDLHSKASQAMGSKLKGLKGTFDKASEEGHSKLFGDDTAEKSAIGSPEASLTLLGSDEESHESPEEEASEELEAPGDHDMSKPVEHMDEHEIDAHIQKLMAHRDHLKSKK